MTARGHSPFGRRGARLPTPAAAIRRPRDPSTTPVARRRRRSVGMRTPTPRHHRWVSHSGRRSGRTNGPRQIGQWSPQISRDSRPCLRGGPLGTPSMLPLLHANDTTLFLFRELSKDAPMHRSSVAATATPVRASSAGCGRARVLYDVDGVSVRLLDRGQHPLFFFSHSLGTTDCFFRRGRRAETIR